MHAEFRSEILDGAKHDRVAFTCGAPTLDRYFRQQALQDYRRGLAVPHVLVEAGPNLIVGFYTLSMRSIDRDALPADVAARLPYRQIPLALIGRLAVATVFQGSGWGRRLLVDAFLRVVGAGREVAAYAVIVEAADERAHAFYEHVGFLPLPDNPRILYLPIETIANLLTG